MKTGNWGFKDGSKTTERNGIGHGGSGRVKKSLKNGGWVVKSFEKKKRKGWQSGKKKNARSLGSACAIKILKLDQEGNLLAKVRTKKGGP